MTAKSRRANGCGEEKVEIGGERGTTLPTPWGEVVARQARQMFSMLNNVARPITVPSRRNETCNHAGRRNQASDRIFAPADQGRRDHETDAAGATSADRTGRIYGRVTSRRDTEKSCRPKVLCMVEGPLEVAGADISEVIDSPGGMSRHSCRVLPGVAGREGRKFQRW